jgi:hypothetical protein
VKSSLISKIINIGILSGFVASIVTRLIDLSKNYQTTTLNIMLWLTVYCLIQFPIIQVLSFWKLGFLKGVVVMLLLMLQLYIALPGINILAVGIVWKINGFAP